MRSAIWNRRLQRKFQNECFKHSVCLSLGFPLVEVNHNFGRAGWKNPTYHEGACLFTAAIIIVLLSSTSPGCHCPYVWKCDTSNCTVGHRTRLQLNEQNTCTRAITTCWLDGTFWQLNCTCDSYFFPSPFWLHFPVASLNHKQPLKTMAMRILFGHSRPSDQDKANRQLMTWYDS